MKDLIKAMIALLFYAGLAPLLGTVLASRRQWQRALFALMVFMPSWHPGKFTLMLGSVEKYRGHVKGFEISLIEVFSIALLVAVTLEGRRRKAVVLKRKGWPPGVWIYLLWCVAGLLSLVNAMEPSLALMAFNRFAKGGLILAAAAFYLREEEDLRWAVGGLAVGLVVQAVLCLKLRYLDGMFQVKGWFEHQNSMAMWAYMSAVPVLGAALHEQVRGRLMLLCWGAVGAGGLCVLVSVSRAALAAYALGCGLVLGLAWLRGPKLRTGVFTGVAALGGVVVVLFGMDSLRARVQEVNESKAVVEEDLRDILNKQSAAMFSDHPIIGLGWNQFGLANSRPHGDKYSQILEDWDEDRGFTIYEENYLANPLTESFYWLWLAETGLTGILTLGLFMLLTLVWALRVAWRERGSLAGVFAAALGVMLVITYFHCSVERILSQPKNLSLWLLLAGMLAGMEWNRRAQAAGG